MFTSAEKFLNWSEKSLASVFKQRRGYLLLAMFFVVLLFINLIFYSIFGFFDIGGGGVLFLIALLVLVGGGLIAAYGFPQTTGKGWVFLASIVLSIGVIPLAPQVFARFPHHLIDRARFYMVHDEYLSKVEMTDRRNGPRFMWFRWGPDDELIFDESDELSYPNRAKPEDWWLRVGKESGFGRCEWQAEKVAQHFYVVSFYCS